MPQATREIKRRIRSIQNTRQITRAMELVSAAKMRRAVQNVLMTRTYASLAWQLLTELAGRTDPAQHPLLAKRYPVKRIGLILVSSNRGLCGGFNHQLVNRVNLYLAHHRQQQVELEADLVAVGRRGRDISFRLGHSIVAEFTKPDVTTRLEEITPIAKLAMADYLSGRYDRVVVAYTDFISPVSQKPRIKQLLPIEEEQDLYLGAARVPQAPAAGWQPVSEPEQASASFNYEYLFEPSPDRVLEYLLPRLLEVQIYQALLESDAAEHSARMMAMRNASDAAKDMIDGLTLAFNQARQSAITTELADITSGRVALEV
ncbi:MAG: ATP synthase F1 subunit gamma [Candidatus Veblenbacteria bacterium]|nr:ATP synthase F1 subunit gamma [Candidatus Veblenbacteria bacterium]